MLGQSNVLNLFIVATVAGTCSLFPIVLDRAYSYGHKALSKISNRIVGKILGLLHTSWYHTLFFFRCGIHKYCCLVSRTVWWGDELRSANCGRTMIFYLLQWRGSHILKLGTMCELSCFKYWLYYSWSWGNYHRGLETMVWSVLFIYSFVYKCMRTRRSAFFFIDISLPTRLSR